MCDDEKERESGDRGTCEIPSLDKLVRKIIQKYENMKTTDLMSKQDKNRKEIFEVKKKENNAKYNLNKENKRTLREAIKIKKTVKLRNFPNRGGVSQPLLTLRSSYFKF